MRDIIKGIEPIALWMCFLLPLSASACDLCSIYSANRLQEIEQGSFILSVAEQITEYGKVQSSGRHIRNEFHQHYTSSFTQVVGQYGINRYFSLQANVPFIIRRFKRIVEGTDGAIEKGTESGIGDISLAFKALPYSFNTEDFSLKTYVLGGVKLPTGDSDRLKEEIEEHEDELNLESGSNNRLSVRGSSLRHAFSDGEALSAVHGHDLALGSGSYDFPVGGGASLRYKRFMADLDLRYVFRSNGDFQYQYADDLSISLQGKYYAVLSHDFSLNSGLNFSYEYKGKDIAPGGQKADDTGIRILYLGPVIKASFGDNLFADAELDIPVDVTSTAFQAVPSYRVKASVSYLF